MKNNLKINKKFLEPRSAMFGNSKKFFAFRSISQSKENTIILEKSIDKNISINYIFEKGRFIKKFTNQVYGQKSSPLKRPRTKINDKEYKQLRVKKATNRFSIKQQQQNFDNIFQETSINNQNILHKQEIQKIIYSTEKISEIEKAFKLFHKINKNKSQVESSKKITYNVQFTLHQIQQLRNLLKAPPIQRDLQSIDSIVSKNSTLNKINRLIRFLFYKYTMFKEYQQKQFIYKQGDQVQKVYLLLRGTLNLLHQKYSYLGQKKIFVIRTICDGGTFGLMQQIYGQQKLQQKTQNPKRVSSMIACQKSYLIQMGINEYKTILKIYEEDDIEKRLKIVRIIPFFRDKNPQILLPLCGLVEKLQFKLGQFVIRQNNPLDAFYVMVKGTCQISHHFRSMRKINNQFMNSCKRNLKFKNFNKNIRSISASRNAKTYAETFDQGYYPELQQKRSFFRGGKQIRNQQMFYNDKIVYGILKIGQIFGGRSFLNHDKLIKKQQRFPNFDYNKYQNIARLSIIASTHLVILYKLQNEKISLLPQNLYKMLIDGLIKEKQYDDIEIEQKKKEYNQWQKYKIRLVQDIIKFGIQNKKQIRKVFI